MMLAGRNVLLTGGSGGIGAELARALVARGARVLLTGRNSAALERVRAQVRPAGRTEAVAIVPADLASAADRDRLASAARQWQGGLDALVNNAGISDFALLENQSAASVEQMIAANLLAPVQLTRSLLPHLLGRPQAAIVNIGSVLGSIGFPGFAVYSATKFALRGFSEALLRELAGSTVSVHYFAPRATRTDFNPVAVDAMHEELGTAVDTPRQVAEALCALFADGRPRATLGWPEKLFVQINALLPGLVDHSLLRQLPIIRKYARLPADPEPEPTVTS